MRALLSLVLLALVASPAIAQPKKEKIAILGLELKGAIDPDSTKVALDLTTQLRLQPKADKGPFSLAQNSDKELLDEKLMNNCETEEKSCMAKIGEALGAQHLLWGNLERKSQGKESGYQVRLILLNTKTLAQQQHTDFLPLAESKDARVGNWARKFYKALTGYNDGGTIVVKVNTDRGTILIENEDRGNITNNRGEVPDLPPGRYRVSVVSEGFHRWESQDKVTVRNGETTSVDVVLVPLDDKPPPKWCDPAVSKSCETTTPDEPGGRGLWKGMFVAGLVIAAGGGGFWYYNYTVLDAATKDLCTNSHDPAKDPSCMVKDEFRPGTINEMGQLVGRGGSFAARDDDAEHASFRTKIGFGVVVGGVVIATVGFVKGILGGGKEKPAAGGTTLGKRGHRGKDFTVVPVVGRESAGATLHWRW